jgi:hypothetical protein
MMNFALWRLSREPNKIVSFSASSAGVCVARVACEDIRQEFGVQVSNEDLCDLATIRGTNNETLSEIANRLFEAGQAKRIDVADHVIGWGELVHFIEISRDDLAARRNEFAWDKSDIPEAMGIAESKTSKGPFSKFEQERDIVARMLGSLVSFSNPNEGKKVESGADVLAKLDDRVMGFQVTQYHSDVNAETKGSDVRLEESRKADLGLPAVTFVNPFSISALIYLIREKAKKGWSQKDFPDMRLLIAASIPQDGGTASTSLFDPLVSVGELNTQLSPILEQTKYSAAYLYVMMPESAYKWTKESGWKKLP